jgi:hypothetical protein
MAKVREKIESDPMISCQYIFDDKFLNAKGEVAEIVYNDFQAYEPVYGNRRKTFFKIRFQIFYVFPREKSNFLYFQTKTSTNVAKNGRRN